jgi:hypothetical protein
MPSSIDHRNTHKDDNSWHNLRAATSMGNAHNSSIPSHNSSGIKGVSYSKREAKWVATLTVAHERELYRLFDNVVDAAKAVREAREKYHREFANHGVT